MRSSLDRYPPRPDETRKDASGLLCNILLIRLRSLPLSSSMNSLAVSELQATLTAASILSRGMSDTIPFFKNRQNTLSVGCSSLTLKLTISCVVSKPDALQPNSERIFAQEVIIKLVSFGISSVKTPSLRDKSKSRSVNGTSITAPTLLLVV